MENQPKTGSASRSEWSLFWIMVSFIASTQLVVIVILVLEDFSDLQEGMRAVVFVFFAAALAIGFWLLVRGLDLMNDPPPEDVTTRLTGLLKRALVLPLLVSAALGVTAWKQSPAVPGSPQPCCPVVGQPAILDPEAKDSPSDDARADRILEVTQLLLDVVGDGENASSRLTGILGKLGGSALESFANALAAGLAERLLSEVDEHDGATSSVQCVIDKDRRRIRPGVSESKSGQGRGRATRWKITGTITCSSQDRP